MKVKSQRETFIPPPTVKTFPFLPHLANNAPSDLDLDHLQEALLTSYSQLYFAHLLYATVSSILILVISLSSNLLPQ